MEGKNDYFLRKYTEAGHGFYFAALEWHNTTSEDMTTSPVQMLMNRRTDTTLPTTREKLEEKAVDHQTYVHSK